MKVEHAEEYTQSLAQIVSGSWRQIAWADREGIPAALGMSTREWVEQRLGGYVRLAIPERRDAVIELADDGRSQREIAAVLGVDVATVNRDLGVANATPNTPDQEQSAPGVANATPTGLTPEQVAEHQRLADVARWRRDGIEAAERIRTFLNGDVATVMGAIELGEDIDRIELCDVLLNAADALKGRTHE